METGDLFELAKNPRLISGIYNYCDRWCERCPFTSRCLTYASLKDDLNDPELSDINNEKFWKKIESNFRQVREMITKMAEEQGINLDKIDVSEEMEKSEQREKEAGEHAVAKAANRYIDMTDKWFEDTEALFKQKKQELIQHMELGLNADIETQVRDINDAVDVIRWYQHQIFIKLMRALQQEDDELFDDVWDDPIQNDANGSAKVALTGIDRSISAFERLLNHFPEKEDELLDILIHLDKLRRGTEKQFPDAHKFIRPGFDEEPVPESP